MLVVCNACLSNRSSIPRSSPASPAPPVNASKPPGAVRESKNPGGKLPIKLPICSKLIELKSNPGGRVMPGGNSKPAGSPPVAGAAVVGEVSAGVAGAAGVAGGGEPPIPGISAIPIGLSVVEP